MFVGQGERERELRDKGYPDLYGVAKGCVRVYGKREGPARYLEGGTCKIHGGLLVLAERARSLHTGTGSRFGYRV
jgi:hypothetical protein